MLVSKAVSTQTKVSLSVSLRWLFGGTSADVCIVSEPPVFLELRVRYLLSCERVGEAAALARCCARHPAAGQHLFFLQVYLTWLFKTSQHDRLHKEVGGAAALCGGAARLSWEIAPVIASVGCSCCLATTKRCMRAICPLFSRWLN